MRLKRLTDLENKLWDSHQVKAFAEQAADPWGAGWYMLSNAGKEKAMLAELASVLLRAPDDRSIPCSEIQALRRDMGRQLGLEGYEE